MSTGFAFALALTLSSAVGLVLILVHIERETGAWKASKRPRWQKYLPVIGALILGLSLSSRIHNAALRAGRGKR